MSSVLKELGIESVINATGPWTVMGNSSLSAGVTQAMKEAAEVFIPIAELQQKAGSIIAQITGSEDGYATPGASAGITLSIAACLTGDDGARMISLPHLEGAPDRVVLYASHRGYYDFAIRATGAKLLPIETDGDALHNLAARLDETIACVFYDCTGLPYKNQTGVPSLQDVVQVAHAAGVRVVADASMAIPPASNLKSIVATGADAVLFTASKAMQGPAASGFIACKRELVPSIAIQNQDLDIMQETGGAVSADTGKYMGLGRSLKVGKEQICGMLVALMEYQTRDHEKEETNRREILEAVGGELGAIPGVYLDFLFSNEGRAPYLILSFESVYADDFAKTVSSNLLSSNPRIFVAERQNNTLCVGAECLKASDAPRVGKALRTTINALRKQ